MEKDRQTQGRTAAETLQLAMEYQKNNSWGEAINMFLAVLSAPDATDQDRQKARVCIELIRDINGFVNTDLMNP